MFALLFRCAQNWVWLFNGTIELYIPEMTTHRTQSMLILQATFEVLSFSFLILAFWVKPIPVSSTEQVKDYKNATISTIPFRPLRDLHFYKNGNNNNNDDE